MSSFKSFILQFHSIDTCHLLEQQAVKTQAFLWKCFLKKKGMRTLATRNSKHYVLINKILQKKISISCILYFIFIKGNKSDFLSFSNKTRKS